MYVEVLIKRYIKKKNVEGKFMKKFNFYLQNVKSNFLIGDNSELLDDDDTCWNPLCDDSWSDENKSMSLYVTGNDILRDLWSRFVVSNMFW